jgi:hypothetical protein
MHQHFCDVTGHDFECSENCECICGLPMEGNDHSDCPVELRPCPKHKDKTERRAAEVESAGVQIDFSILSPERQQSKPPCQCGCANADCNVVGFCIWCDHVYVEYSPATEARHFAHDCPGAPKKLKQASLAGLAKREAINRSRRCTNHRRK